MEQETVIGGKYVMKELIGSGSFGEVHNGVCTTTKENIALKIERMRSVRPQLENEYRIIRNLQGGIGIPRVYWYGVESNFNAMATELLGGSLDSLFKLCKASFSIKTILLIADQCISRLEYIHSKLYIHRDIKPENFLIGLGRKSHVIHLIDFGLSKRYIEQGNNKHIKYKEGKSLTGTARYVSVFTHLGIEQSRRDDLESLGYMLVFLANGSLPWVGIPGKNKAEKYKLIGQCKAEKTFPDLCYGLPHEFVSYFTYCKALKFEQKPDYALLKKGFKEAFNRMQYTYDYIFDWDLRRSPSPRKATSFSKDRKDKRESSVAKDCTGFRESTPLDNYIRRDNFANKECARKDSPVKDIGVRKDSPVKVDNLIIREPQNLFSTLGAFPSLHNSPIKSRFPRIDSTTKYNK